jgi:thiamine-phosphate pyrophosphorylase
MSMPVTRTQRLKLFGHIDLYVVTCEPLSRGRSDIDVLEAVIAGGGRIIQLRDKVSSARDMYAKAEVFRARTRDAGVLLIINDYMDIALAVAADGVHLGQEDLPLEAARKIAPEMILGRSTHSLSQALEAQAQGADYVNIGPLFPTGTKEHAHVLGVAAVQEIAPQLHIPFTVMGGIVRARMPGVVAAGATKIAVVTAVTQADDMTVAVRDLRAEISKAGYAARPRAAEVISDQ